MSKTEKRLSCEMSTGISIVVNVCFLSYNLALRGYVIESFDFMIYVSKFHLT